MTAPRHPRLEGEDPEPQCDACAEARYTGGVWREHDVGCPNAGPPTTITAGPAVPVIPRPSSVQGFALLAGGRSQPRRVLVDWTPPRLVAYSMRAEPGEGVVKRIQLDHGMPVRVVGFEATDVGAGWMLLDVSLVRLRPELDEHGEHVDETVPLLAAGIPAEVLSRVLGEVGGADGIEATAVVLRAVRGVPPTVPWWRRALEALRLRPRTVLHRDLHLTVWMRVLRRVAGSGW